MLQALGEFSQGRNVLARKLSLVATVVDRKWAAWMDNMTTHLSC